MFLAAKFRSSCGYNSVSIQTVNSDLAILARYYAPNLTKEASAKVYLRALPDLYAFWGCDSRVHFTALAKKSG